MAMVGGMGFLHYNMTQDEQVEQLRRVKAHRPGYVMSPTVPPLPVCPPSRGVDTPLLARPFGRTTEQRCAVRSPHL
jgi:hypothetical protein